MPRLFISHSFRDGVKHAAILTEALQSIPGVDVFSPTDHMRLGASWVSQVGTNISGSEADILVMTKDSLRWESSCRLECVVAQDRGIPVIPVRMEAGLKLYPQFVWPNVVWVDCAVDFAEGLAKLSREVAVLSKRGAVEHAIPQHAWDVKRGPFSDDAALYLGQWFVEVKPPKRRISLVKHHVLKLFPNRSFEQQLVIDRKGLSRVRGTWGLDPDKVTLRLAAGKGQMLEYRIDGSAGPNWFAGSWNETRFTARRMLELDR
ncbi:TIR domain-containing protein [Humibacillus xanthopallidus]|uniref:TIR domain-containing protein n=1 Tax=Humibacillus xanthopallidus TaxID=412689 RepID=UPI00384FFBEC